MRTLLDLIWKHHFTLLFLLLETGAFALLIQSNKFHKAQFLSSTSVVSGGFYDLVSNVTDYFELKDVNEELLQENARLRSTDPNAFIEWSGNKIYINDTLHHQRYRYQGAKVVNSTVNHRNNYLILDKGRAHGIRPEMGVISPQGVVGIVLDVSDGYCSVISVLHQNCRVAAKLQDSDYFGILEWGGGDPLTADLRDIPRHVELTVGDKIVTRGSSTVFPAGVPIGTISSFELPAGSNFYEVEVKLSTDFYNVSSVYVVSNLMKSEQLTLEAKFNDD